MRLWKISGGFAGFTMKCGRNDDREGCGYCDLQKNLERRKMATVCNQERGECEEETMTFGDLYVCVNPQCEAYNRSEFRHWYAGKPKKCLYCDGKLELKRE